MIIFERGKKLTFPSLLISTPCKSQKASKSNDKEAILVPGAGVALRNYSF